MSPPGPIGQARREEAGTIEGDEALVEHGKAARQRHARIVALQDLLRAKADLASATGASAPDPETAIRLEVIEQELTVLRRQAGSRSRKRDERRVLDLLLSERLLLDQLGFATYLEYSTWLEASVGAHEADDADLAYLEFARLALDSAKERLDTIDASELEPATDGYRPSDSGELEPYLVVPDREPEGLTTASIVPHGAPLEAWTAEPSPEGQTAPADGSPSDPSGSADVSALPDLVATNIDDLDLPYWDEST
jgi:hypothetical protein